MSLADGAPTKAVADSSSSPLKTLRRQPSALAFWHNNGAGAGSSSSSNNNVNSTASSSSSSLATSSAEPSNKANNRKSRLFQDIKRKRNFKKADKLSATAMSANPSSSSSQGGGGASGYGSDPAQQQALSEMWSSDSEPEDEIDGQLNEAQERDVGIGSSTGRPSSSHRSSSRSSPSPLQDRSLPGAPPTSKVDEQAVNTRTAPPSFHRVTSGESAEFESFYDATEDDEEDSPSPVNEEMMSPLTEGDSAFPHERCQPGRPRPPDVEDELADHLQSKEALGKKSTATLRQEDFAGSHLDRTARSSRSTQMRPCPVALESSSLNRPMADLSLSFLPTPPAPYQELGWHGVLPHPPRPLPDGRVPTSKEAKILADYSLSPSSSSGGPSSSMSGGTTPSSSMGMTPSPSQPLSQSETMADLDRRMPKSAIEPRYSPSALDPLATGPSSSSNSPSSLGPSGTIRGRPRGATVGAVPSSSRNLFGRFSNAMPPRSSRPRSLLSHEPLMPQSDSPAAPGTPLGSQSSFPSSTAVAPASSSAENSSSRRTSLDTGNESASTNNSGLLDGTVKPPLLSDPAVSTSSTNKTATPPTSQAMLTAATTPQQQPTTGRSRSGSSASALLHQVHEQPRSHASFVIAVVGHKGSGKSTVIKKGLRQFGLSKPQVLSDRVTSHSTICIVNQEQRTIEVLEMDISVLMSGSGKGFTCPKFLPHIDAVIVCYDASSVSSFKYMSELLEFLHMESLDKVMLACKSDLEPKAVDPFYASEMAGSYNVGLAECTVHSEEGKKRMRDCFSYLVKEVAKSRAGRAKASPANGGGIDSSGSSFRSSISPSRVATDATPSEFAARRPSGSSAPEGQHRVGNPAAAQPALLMSQRDRVSSTASLPASTSQPGGNSNESHQGRLRDVGDKNGQAVPKGRPDEDTAVTQSMSRAQLGLQSAKAAGGYVTLEELWDKLFFAAVSGNDDRFLLMFMVFYRGFVRPVELLKELIARFETLAGGEHTDGIMIRFSLMRLTAMLGDWMQDYPGDLSSPECYPLLCDFFDRLCTHPSTTHIASPLRPYLETIRDAPDLDAAWSRDQDSSKPKSVAADVPPVRPPLAVDAGSPSRGDGSGDSIPTAADVAAALATRDRSDSVTSSAGLRSEASEGSQNSAVSMQQQLTTASTSTTSEGAPHRPRSQSDVTAFSADGHRGSSSAAGSSSAHSGADSHYSSNNQPTEAAPLVPQQQKLALRAVSHALEALDDRLIADELTRLEWNLFLAIRPRDLLRHILVSRQARGSDGPVARSIAHFNYISGWVCSMILVQSKTKHRAKMLEKFMNIAAILRHDNNYNTLQAVLAGLGNASVHRLKNTRELLNGKPVNKTYLSLARLMGSDRSFSAYRLALANSHDRTIPYLGVHLQDILSMSDGNPSKRASDHMVHWRKFSLMDEAVMAIVRCQQHHQNRPRANPSVEKLIMRLPIWDEDALYGRSLQAEPRQAPGNATSAGSKIMKILNSAA